MNWHRQWWCFPVLIAVGLSSSVCRAQSLVYSSKELHGQVVETETGQSVEGAVVVASWLLSPTIWGHEQYHKRLHIVETVTDAEGRFVIPAWGPKLLPPLTALDETNPRLAVFKSEYRPKFLSNKNKQTTTTLDADWNGQVVQLARFQSTTEEEARYIEAFYDELSRGHDDLLRDWKNYPRATLAVYRESQRLRSRGLKPGYFALVPNIERLNKADRELLRRYEK
jgi:hypothetical protein